MKIPITFILVLVGAILLSSCPNSLAGQNDLQILLSFDKQEFIGDEDIWGLVELQNTGKQALRMDEPYLAPGNESLGFHIQNPAGESLSFVGPMPSRVRTFKTLAPGGNARWKFNLRHHYRLALPGVYKITAHYRRTVSEEREVTILEPKEERLVVSQSSNDLQKIQLYQCELDGGQVVTKAKLVLGGDQVFSSRVVPIDLAQDTVLQVAYSRKAVGLLIQKHDGARKVYSIGHDADVLEREEVPTSLAGQVVHLVENDQGRFTAAKHEEVPSPKSQEQSNELPPSSRRPSAPMREVSVSRLVSAVSRAEVSKQRSTLEDATGSEPKQAVEKKLIKRTITFDLLEDRALSISDLARLLAINGRCKVRLILGGEAELIDGDSWKVRSSPDFRFVPPTEATDKMFIPHFVNATVYDAFSTLAEAASLSFEIAEDGVVVLRGQ